MKAQFDSLAVLSKVEKVQLVDMLGWLPKHPSLPNAPAEPQANPARHVHQWFDAHAECSPDSLALYSSEMGKSMTYGQLHASTEEKAKCEFRVPFMPLGAY